MSSDRRCEYATRLRRRKRDIGVGLTGSDRPFDMDGFYAALNARRNERGLRWVEVARAVGVSPSTLTRLGQGSRPDVDTYFKLCAWANLGPEDFARPSRVDVGGSGKDSALPAMVAALRADRTLDDDDVRVLEQVLTAAYTGLRKAADPS